MDKDQKDTLAKCTENNQSPAPGWALDQMARHTVQQPGISDEVAERLLKKARENSTHVKLKALRAVCFIARRGSMQFRRACVARMPDIRVHLEARGRPDPVHGDAPWRMIRETAKFSLADDRGWWHSHGEPYVDALVEALPAGTPGLILWDVVNEPESGGSSGLPGERGTRWAFVRHFVSYFQSKTSTPATTGVASVASLGVIGDAVDVLTFHSYHAGWEEGLMRTHMALSFAQLFAKPVFNSETGCIARANAFDQTMEMAARNGIGFAVWELMISDCLDCIDTRRWKHGLMYTDGTTRDPAAIAALHGVYLNRGDNVALAVPRPDVEGVVSAKVASAEAWVAHHSTAPFGDGVALLDALANLGESAQVVPLVVPLSYEARRLGAAGESPATRRELAALLVAQLGALSATKLGAETAPGVCTFPGAPPPPLSCAAQAAVCTFTADTDLRFFDYTPPSSSRPGNRCWHGVGGTPGGGTLHYCDQPRAHADFSLGADLDEVVLVYKSGPDCGFMDVLLDGKVLYAGFDTYSAAVDWQARLTLLNRTVHGTSGSPTAPHVVRIVVRGTHAPHSSNAWVQLVGVERWRAAATVKSTAPTSASIASSSPKSDDEAGASAARAAVHLGAAA